MKGGARRVIRVEWEGTFSIDEVREMNNENDGPGLYQIYGRHLIYGSGILLYIGKSEKQLVTRVKQQHASWKSRKPWHQEDDEFLVRLGWLDYKGVDFRKVLADVEAFEIFYHSPAYNEQYISTYHGQSLIVVNEGQRGDLCYRLSSPATKCFLKVIEVKPENGTARLLQSDEFEVTNEEWRVILHEAFNSVLYEDLRDLFEKPRWGWSGNDIRSKVHFDEKGNYTILFVGQVKDKE